nr:hypothetical protein [Tanacetum cinerariifolium]
TEGQGAAAVQVTRDKMDEEFIKIENNRELADIQATNILSQGLPRRKKELFDEYERFHAIGNESIHDYFVCFHKLINDMKITQLDIHAHQMNTKFINNLPPYWAKYVTNVKNNKDISATTYVELYTYLKSYEPHALKTLKKQEQSSSIVDPLTYHASTTHHLTPTQPTSPPPSTSSLTLPPQLVAQSSNDATLATMNQIVNLLSGFQKQFPPTNNQLRTSSNSRSHTTVHDEQIVTETVQRKAPGNVGNTGHVSRQCKEKKRVKYSQYFKDKMLLMEAKEKEAVLDAEVEAFLADVEYEGPHAAVAFMDNLSSTSGTNGATISHFNEVHTDDNQIFDNVIHLLAHEMHKEEHLDSDVESDIDDNTIPFHQYQLDSEVQDVPTEVYYVSPGEISMITILDDLRNQLDGHLKAKIAQPTLYDGHALLKPTNTYVRVHDSEESLVQAEEQLQGKDDTIRKLQTHINSMSMLNVKPTIGSFDKQALETELTRLKDAITSVRIQNDGFKKPKVLASGMYAISSKYIVPPRRVNRAEPTPLPKKKQATFQEPPIPSNRPTQKIVVHQNKKPNIHVNLSIGVEPTTGASKHMSKSDTRNHSTLPAKREKARRVKDHHRNLNKHNHVDSRLNVKCTDFVSNSNTVCNACNESLVFANHDNCVVRNLKSVNVKTPTAKHNVKLLRKLLGLSGSLLDNVLHCMMRVKPATGASKPMSKSDTRNHSTLSAKREKARRVEDHHRNLNKQNHIDSRLNVKRTGFVSNSNTVCNACNEFWFLLIMITVWSQWKPTGRRFTLYDEYPLTRIVEPVVEPLELTPCVSFNSKVTMISRSQWKPTGRRFTLYDEYPLTRIVEPVVEPLELTPCVSFNSKVTMISRFIDYKLSNRKAGSKGISGSSNCPMIFGFRMLSAYDR